MADLLIGFFHGGSVDTEFFAFVLDAGPCSSTRLLMVSRASPQSLACEGKLQF